jgi:hypothetical protein
MTNVLRLLAALLVAAPAIAGSEDEAAPWTRGPYVAGFTHFTAHDSSRNMISDSTPKPPRPVPIFVFYPADPSAIGPGTSHALYPRDPFRNLPVSAFSSVLFERQGIDPAYEQPTPAEHGRFPLVVFSTGARAPWWYNVGTATRLASHGFVVALLAHYGDGAVHPAPQAFPVNDPQDPLQNAAQRGLDKPKDISFAIDQLLARNRTPGDLLHQLIDPRRIAASGHSFGGLAAIMLVAGHDRVCDAFPNANAPPAESCVALAADPRIGALVLLDSSSQNLKWKDLTRLHVPTIGINEDPFSLEANFGAGFTSLGGRQHAAIPGPPSFRADILRTMHVPSLLNACQMAYVRADTEGFVEDGRLQPVTPVFSPAQRDAELARLSCLSPALTPYTEANAIVWRYSVAFLKAELARADRYRCMLTTRFSIEHEPNAGFFAHEAKTGDPGVDFPDDSWFYKTELDVPPAHDEEEDCDFSSDDSRKGRRD